MVLEGYLVPAGTTLVTPVLNKSKPEVVRQAIMNDAILQI